MDLLRSQNISFLTNSSFGQLCENLNEIIGQGIYYVRFDIHNTKRLWFVSNVFIAIKSDKTLSGRFGIYPRFVAGILNSARRINFFVLCN